MPGKPVPILVLFGPTASGKTDILINLFCVGTGYGAEIVSADSMQVYRGLDIGTAKPQAAIRAALPHHLIDILNPDEQFNAGEFVRRADAACDDIYKRGLLPVVSGGTGFYLKNFIQGLPASPPSDTAVREKLTAEFHAGSREALIAELRQADPESAARIHPNDDYRLLRALEVVRLTGRPLSACEVNGESRREKYHFLLIGLEWERDTLYRRIDSRCSQMFRMGLAEEVRVLFDKGYTPDDPGLKAIGYKEFFVKDDDDAWRLSRDLAGVESLIAQHCHQYAKRQITWFRKVSGVTWLKLYEYPESGNGAADRTAFSAAVAAIQKELAFFLEKTGGL
jgi:tRNA dimethylallyltransferase